MDSRPLTSYQELSGSVKVRIEGLIGRIEKKHSYKVGLLQSRFMKVTDEFFVTKYVPEREYTSEECLLEQVLDNVIGLRFESGWEIYHNWTDVINRLQEKRNED